MKKWILFIFVFILVNSAFAGKIYDIDFYENPTHIVMLNERDIVRFNFPVREYIDKDFGTLEEKRNSRYVTKEVEEKVMIRRVNQEKGIVDITIFIYGAETPQYGAVTKRTMVRIDFERDNIIDLLIGLDNIDGKRVALILQKVSLEKGDETKSAYKIIITKILGILKEKNVLIYYILGGILILILLLKNKKIREYFASEE